MEEYLRKSTNILLLKDDLGKSKPASYPLPGPDFAFGKSVGNDAEGAKEVVGSWNFHRPSKANALKRDFKSLNKLGVRLGASTSKDISQMRRTNEAFVPRKEPQKAIKVILPDEEFAYGMPNRPSTPINSVLCHQYGEQASNIIGDIYKARLEEQARKTTNLPKITKSVKLVSETSKQKLQELNNTTQKPLFKMKKFQKVQCKIDDMNHKYIKERSLVGSAHQDRVRSVERLNT